MMKFEISSSNNKVSNILIRASSRYPTNFMGKSTTHRQGALQAIQKHPSEQP